VQLFKVKSVQDLLLSQPYLLFLASLSQPAFIINCQTKSWPLGWERSLTCVRISLMLQQLVQNLLAEDASGIVPSGFVKFINPGIEAETASPGTDWIIQDQQNSIFHLDVRTRARTDIGEIYLQYGGIMTADTAATNVSGGTQDAKNTEFGDSLNRFIKPLVEASDHRMKWLETSALNGEGRWVVDEQRSATEYAVYKVGG
jgi:hypothetical protein